MKRPSQRRTMVLVVLASLAVAAGFAVTNAFATDAHYCNGCTLPSSGVPAVSAVHNTFFNNFISTYPGFHDEQNLQLQRKHRRHGVR